MQSLNILNQIFRLKTLLEISLSFTNVNSFLNKDSTLALDCISGAPPLNTDSHRIAVRFAKYLIVVNKMKMPMRIVCVSDECQKNRDVSSTLESSSEDLPLEDFKER